MNTRIASMAETETGTAIAERFVAELIAAEPMITDQDAPHYEALALMNSIAQHLSIAIARRYGGDGAAQTAAVSGYACGLVSVFYQKYGAGAGGWLALHLERGIAEGVRRAEEAFAPKSETRQ